MKLLTAFTVCLPAVFSQQPAPNVRVANERAVARVLARMNTDQRLALFETRVKADPSSVEMRVELASAYLQKMRESADNSYFDRASKIVEGVLQSAPGNYGAARLRLELSMFRHEFPSAIEQARELHERQPGDSGILGILGDALMERGRYEESGVAYNKMVMKRPDLTSYNRLAYHKFVTGDPTNALILMRLAVEAGSRIPENEAWCLVELGDLYRKAGTAAEAAQSYRRALERFPGYHRALAAQGRLLAAQGNTAEGIRLLSEAQSRVPLPEYAGALEQLHRLAANTAEAVKQQQLLDASDRLAAANGEKANRLIAMFYADSGRNLKRALELAEAEFAVRDDVYSYDTRAWVLFKLNRLDEAAADMKRALQHRTPEPSFLYHAAAIAAARGEARESGGYLARLEKLHAALDAAQQLEVARLSKSLRSR